ncbi:Kiwa anti-phage protein KwaB-like domain-containing protein [Georgenia faecalis]|uniref:Kiwa anti-phage protein KwaB-like domain-containing protein n=1 Tax=Georgenia faecalis TaxID=2483799 RepID=UPI000FD7E659|nr:Kiwa anti-phage protein KwaB-like domain-containing protein [Georgenia faecalis]
MTADAARQVLINALAAKPAGLSNFVIRGEALSNADVTRYSLVREMAATVCEDVVKAVDALTKKQFLDYDPSYQTSSSQVLVEKLTEIPELAARDLQVRLGDVDLDAGGDRVVALAHTVGADEHQIVAYRLKGPGIATRRAKGITLIPRNGIYRPVEGDVLYYEPRFDTFTCGGYVYFTTISLIQTKLQADDKARELAKKTLTTVTAQLVIDGFDDLEKAVMDDPNLRAKMAAVARLFNSDPDYAKNLTTAKLVRFVRSNPDYNIPTSTMNGKRALRFDPSPQHRHQIPRLLADDYLHSYLTDRNYEAGSKQRVKA